MTETQIIYDLFAEKIEIAIHNMESYQLKRYDVVKCEFRDEVKIYLSSPVMVNGKIYTTEVYLGLLVGNIHIMSLVRSEFNRLYPDLGIQANVINSTDTSKTLYCLTILPRSSQ